MKKYFLITSFILWSIFVVILINSDDENTTTDKQSSIKQINNWKLVK